MPFVESAAYRVYDEEHGRGDAILFVGGITVDHTGFGLQVESLSRDRREGEELEFPLRSPLELMAVDVIAYRNAVPVV